MSEARKLAEPMAAADDMGEALSPTELGGSLALLSKAEIDQQIATARKYPRSVTRFRKQALDLVTLNEAVAQQCIYAIPRDGKMIEGPSIRFAEVMASTWGNCRYAARVVDEGAQFVTAQGVFHDLEHNNAISFEVKRRIIDKRGRRFGVDMIGVTANAASSIALRNAILRGVPKALWGDIYDAARKVVMGDFKTLRNRRADALTAFLAYGITDAQIYRKLGVGGENDIGMEQLVALAGMLTALKDEEMTPEEMFSDEAPASNGAGDVQALKKYPPENGTSPIPVAGLATAAVVPAATNGAASPPLAPPVAEEVRAAAAPLAPPSAPSPPPAAQGAPGLPPNLFGEE